MTPDTVRLLRQYRAVELTKPEASQKVSIIAGYAAGPAWEAFVGIIIGLNLLYAKKKLLDGTPGSGLF